MANFSLGTAVDILRGNIGSRDGQGVLAGVREARRCVETGSRIGENKAVLDAPGAEGDQADDLLAEELALTERLEAIREARAARNAC